MRGKGRGSGSNFKNDELPVPYVNPWKVLREDINAVRADICLGLRKGWRLNREGSLPYPPFWPSSWGSLFWPFISFLVVVVFFQLNFKLLSLNKSVLESSVGIPDSSSLIANSSEMTLPKETSTINMETESNETTLEHEILQQDSYVNELLAEFREDDLPNGLLLDVKQKSLGNKMVIILGDDWLKIPTLDKIRLANRLRERSNQLGYKEIELKDTNQNLLSRSPMVGLEMIMFNQEN